MTAFASKPSEGISTIADVEKLEKIPLSTRELPKNIFEAICAGGDICDGRDALVFLPDAENYDRAFRWSYPDLIANIRSVAQGLLAVSNSGNPVTSLLLPNLPETHFTLWGAQIAGQANPINPLLEPSQIADILDAGKTEILVTLDALPGTDLYDKAVKAARLSNCVETIVTIDPSRYAGRLKSMAAKVAIHIKRKDAGRPVISFKTLKQRGAHTSPIYPSSTDIAALYHTGGTTGAPKIAQLTHGNQVFVGWAAAANRFMETNKSIFCGLPLFHVNGALVTGLVSWMNGATVVLGPPQGFRAKGLLENFWAIVARYKIGAMSAVPTIYQSLLEHEIGEYDVSSLEFGICGAAPISRDAFDRFQRQTGIKLLEGYGFTEGACISSINPGYGERRLGSVGLRLPYQRIKIFQEPDESGVFSEAPLGQPGVIAVRGPNVFAGYRRAEDDAKAWIHHEGEKWYNSGDMGRFDDDGYLWLTGRKKELIIRGGHNIDPALIENALAEHPAVEMVAAIGSPHARLGEVPVAYVTLLSGQTATQNELLNFAAAHITERAAIPKAIFIEKELPLTAIGKTFKPELVARETARVIRERLGETIPNNGLHITTRRDSQRGLMAVIGGTGFQSDAQRKIIEQTLEAFTFNWEFSDEETF